MSMTEFVLYGGKGGVGKTTLAAATGLRRAENGENVLVVSTDPAHSLADVYEAEVNETPTQVRDVDGLYALEIDPRDRFRSRYGDSFESLLEEVQSYGVNVEEDDVTDIAERGLIPGADEVAVVDLFAEYDDHDRWDTVVFDTAPTGHTLRLLRLPDVMSTTVGKVLSLRQSVDNAVNTVKGLLGGGSEKESQLAKLDNIDDVMDDVGDRLRDPERTTFRAVTLPEEMAVAETERLLGQLDEAEIHVGHILANKVLMDIEEDCKICGPRHEQEQAVLQDANERFNRPVSEVPLVVEHSGWERVERVEESLPDDA